MLLFLQQIIRQRKDILNFFSSAKISFLLCLWELPYFFFFVVQNIAIESTVMGVYNKKKQVYETCVLACLFQHAFMQKSACILHVSGQHIFDLYYMLRQYIAKVTATGNLFSACNINLDSITNFGVLGYF